MTAEKKISRLYASTEHGTRKIGLLFGFERSFPVALREEINKRAVQDADEHNVIDESGGQVSKVLRFVCEDVKVDVLDTRLDGCSYDVLLDRISHDVPCYQPVVKLAALQGTKVICDPFLRYTDDKFLQAALCSSLNIPHPRTFLLPSHSYSPCRTTQQSLSNLSFPLSFHHVFETLKFPFYIKPVASFGWQNVCLVRNECEFYRAYDASGENVMIAQERVEWMWYLRCLHVDREVFPARWDPVRPPGERYSVVGSEVPEVVVEACVEAARKLCQTMGYVINSVEFAIQFTAGASSPAADLPTSSVSSAKSAPSAEFESTPSSSTHLVTDAALYPAPLYQTSDNTVRGYYTPFVIDMLNSVPDFDRDLSLGDEIFKWVVTKVADCLVRKALEGPNQSSYHNGSCRPEVDIDTERDNGTECRLYMCDAENGLIPHVPKKQREPCDIVNGHMYKHATGEANGVHLVSEHEASMHTNLLFNAKMTYICISM